MVTKHRNSCKTQIFTCLWVDLLGFAYGASVGWLSPTISLLSSPNTPLESGPLSTDEVSMIGSFSCFGGFFAASIYGWIAGKIGRKFALISLGFPQLFGWMLVYFARNSYYLIASRLLHGFSGGGIFIVVPLFVTEISDDRIRGRLGSLLVFSSNSGILFAYILCAYINYYTNCICLMMITILFFVGVFFIHDSPIYLMSRNKDEEAREALRFYNQNLRYGDNHTRNEFNVEYEKLKALIEHSHCNINNKIRASDFCTKAAVKSIIIGIAMMTFGLFNGTFALLSYASLIFKESGSNLSPNNSAITVGMIQLISLFMSIILVDRAGRKLLLIISSICCTIGLSVFSVYNYLQAMEYDLSKYNFIPLVCFSFIILSANFGLVPLPFVILPEITPMKIKSVVYSFNLCFSWLVALLTVLYLPLSIETIGIYGTMAVFAVSCFIAIFFIGFYIPETKNRSIEEIQEIMSK